MSRPLGPLVENWKPTPLPYELHLQGHWASLKQTDAGRDAEALWSVFHEAPWVWDYLAETPPPDFETFANIMQVNADRVSQPCYTISRVKDDFPLGYACFWTVVEKMGSVEIGNVNLSPPLQQTPIATEAFFLMIDWAFANGYRRMEWKCNALNAPSRKAAQRMGFSYEGVFRNHAVIKGRSRDTAWFAITDEDWPALRDAFLTWLAPDNFDAQGRQKTALSDFTKPHLFQTDPAT